MRESFKWLITTVTLGLFCVATLPGCYEHVATSDERQQAQQEAILQQGTSTVGMPAIANFRERKLLKQIYELRDRSDYLTYTYTYSEYTGKFTFFCRSIGFAIPYATQFTSPQKIEQMYGKSTNTYLGVEVVPQADPNGLYSPAAADASWVMCVDPTSKDHEATAVYVEPKLTTVRYKLPMAIGNPAD